jgi:thiamine biosynthesis lipoprotein
MTISGDKGIDLGGIGKGYLIDKLADILLNKFALPYFLINGGGDMYMTSNQGEEIEVFLEHPTDVGSYLNTIKIKNGAFCSSSSFKRSWIHNGKPVNHFIAEKEVWAASFVLGPTTTMADMYATVFCILSDNKDLLKELSKKETLDYLVIDSNGVTAKSSSFPSFIQP